MRLAILMIAALLAGTYECAASCASAHCESSCHHDKKAPVACSHELVLHRTAQIQALDSIAIPVQFSIESPRETSVFLVAPLPPHNPREAVVFPPLRV